MFNGGGFLRQYGPSDGPIGGIDVLLAVENKDSETISMGQAVSPHPGGSGLWAATAVSSARYATGLALSDIAPGMSGKYRIDGLFTLNDWTAVTGSSLLGVLTRYYIGTINGKLTSLPNTTPGLLLQYVGVAITPTTLELNFQPAILL